MIDWPVQFVASKYSKWYEALIQKAQLRGTVEGYSEDHHIIPRSIGGSNRQANLVTLTAREHYIAHLLLWKSRFPAPYHKKMCFAINVMSNKVSPSKKRTYKVNSKLYESIKKDYIIHQSEAMKGEGNNFYGKKHTPETMEKLMRYHNNPETKRQKSERVAGDKNPSKNPEVKKLISAAQKERMQRDKLLGKGSYSQSYKDKQSAAHSGANNGRALTVKFTDPFGKEHIVTGYMKKFCLSNNLSYSQMLKTAQGKLEVHRGWKVSYLKDKNE
jgi:hypothetical protein